jgi:hypothetical protein
MRKLLIASAVSIAMILFGGTSSAASQDQLNTTLSKQQTQLPSWLFVLAVPEGKISVENNQAFLTLHPVRHIMYFSDRPIRKSGGMKVEKFLAMWSKAGGNNSFQKDAPNAALVAALESDQAYHTDNFLTLSNPTYDKKSQTLTFSIAPLNTKEKIKAETLKETALFIDNIICGNYSC